MNREQFQLKRRLVYGDQVLPAGNQAERRQCPLPPYMAFITGKNGVVPEQNLGLPASTSARERGNGNLVS